MTTLAEFLRSRRQDLQPVDVGLPPGGGRRRTPGLRREEVATLAGVSVDYLVRLEQGRDIHPSPSVLTALAGALRLADDQRTRMFRLAAIGASPELCPASEPPATDVAPTVRALLRRLEPAPAFVHGPSGDVLAWNLSWERLVRPLGLLDELQPNLARHLFLHPKARSVYSDWAAVADEHVSRLRAAGARCREEQWFVELVDELTASPAFTERWASFSGAERSRGQLRLASPAWGSLAFDYETLVLPDDADQRLVTWLPADEATAAAVAASDEDTVASSPARLRVIG